MARSVEYQSEINQQLADDCIRKLKTSINNYEKKRGHTEYVRLTHVQSDCLSVFVSLEKVALLQLMRDAPETTKYDGPTTKHIPRADVDG